MRTVITMMGANLLISALGLISLLHYEEKGLFWSAVIFMNIMNYHALFNYLTKKKE